MKNSVKKFKRYTKKLNLEDTIKIGNSGYSVMYEMVKDRSDYNKNLLLEVDGKPTYLGVFNWVDRQGDVSQAISTEINVDNGNYKWKATRIDDDIWDSGDFSDGLITRNKIGSYLINTNNYLMDFTIDGCYDYKATKALQFYEDCVDHLGYCEASGKELGFDWDRCRAYCKVGKTYSKSKFMLYVAIFFETTVSEMKEQWRNIR